MWLGKFTVASLYLLRGVTAQQVGTLEKEENPTMTLKECTSDGCTSKQMKLVLDANWRWLHSTSGYQDCYKGKEWNTELCPDPATCSKNCALEGVTKDKYENTYGVSQLPNGVTLKLVTKTQYGDNIGSRLYMLDDDGERYKLFRLKNREFAMDFDVSHLGCGVNGAMYFVEMDENGGMKGVRSPAGAKYGTGYCDAQCPHDTKFIGGEANMLDWNSNARNASKTRTTGRYGSCCAELDIWEANGMSTAFTEHPCSIDGQSRCEGVECGDLDQRYMGICDKDGCDMNAFRMGNNTFYGRGPLYKVDSLKPMTVVTQFVTTDGTDTGDLAEMRRFYVQDGKVIHSPKASILGPDAADSITDNFCKSEKALFEDLNDFQIKGASKKMGESLDKGHVLTLSLWDDVEANMLWLDSAYPLSKPKTKPGVLRGECPGGEQSTPTYIREHFPDAHVTFTNAYVGPIGSLLQDLAPALPTPAPAVPAPTPTPAPASPTPAPENGCAKLCARTDLTASGKYCRFMSLFKTLCAASYIVEGGVATPCAWIGDKCREDDKNALTCPKLAAVCAAAGSV